MTQDRAVVVAVDSFKGSLTSNQACLAVARGWSRAEPDRQVLTVPVADGGEGTLDAALAAGFSAVSVRCHGATGDLGTVDYARRGDVAVIEMAACCGLERADRVSGPPTVRRGLVASSAGLGEVMAAALRAGATSLIIGIGGSASTDAGAGMLEALGARLLEKDGSPVEPGAAGLAELEVVDLSELNPRLREVSLTVACDVTSPLLGPSGAAAVFGPQKGLDGEAIDLADRAIGRFADTLESGLGVRHRDDPGAGAAGGVGWALMCLGARYRPGAGAVLEWTRAAEKIARAEVVVTGEGRLDHQTMLGKLPSAIRTLAHDAGAQVWAVCGRCDLDEGERRRFDRVLELSAVEPDPNRSMANAGVLLRDLVEQEVRAWVAGADGPGEEVGGMPPARGLGPDMS